MKRSGLSNRFSLETRNIWLDWYECNVCGFNQQDVLHHIVSPSISAYVAGKHNESVYNSCPIHNYTHPNARQLKEQNYSGFGVDRSCHIGNEAYLGENAGLLLRKTESALLLLGYKDKPEDIEFKQVYCELYKNGKI